ncbi:hypothetical protein evm_009861 [Chilo suppressalis]|nr:hypothetical protein evm_009861 [Chilo suppressalis]
MELAGTLDSHIGYFYPENMSRPAVSWKIKRIMEASKTPLDLLSIIASEQIRITLQEQQNSSNSPDTDAAKNSKRSSNHCHKKSFYPKAASTSRSSMPILKVKQHSVTMTLPRASSADSFIHSICNVKHAQVPIGDGHAEVPGRLLKHLNWTSYTACTRKLLTAVFPREVLATHTLTGKASPAFPNKPAKEKLDPRLVQDIIQTVMDKCGVTESQVRTIITAKCADECKMSRARSLNNSNTERHNTRNNVTHESTSSE